MRSVIYLFFISKILNVLGYTSHVEQLTFTSQHTNKGRTRVQEIEGNVGEMNNRFEASLSS